MKRCPTCGQPVPPESDNDVLSWSERKVYEMLIKAGSKGTTAVDLMKGLYPNNRTVKSTTVHQFIKHLKYKLVVFDQTVRSTHGPHARYYLVRREK